MVLVSHPNTNPTWQGLTSVNFTITKLSDAQRAHLWQKEVVTKPMFLDSLLFVILQRLECCISIPHNSVPSDFL